MEISNFLGVLYAEGKAHRIINLYRLAISARHDLVDGWADTQFFLHLLRWVCVFRPPTPRYSHLLECLQGVGSVSFLAGQWIPFPTATFSQTYHSLVSSFFLSNLGRPHLRSFHDCLFPGGCYLPYFQTYPNFDLFCVLFFLYSGTFYYYFWQYVYSPD